MSTGSHSHSLGAPHHQVPVAHLGPGRDAQIQHLGNSGPATAAGGIPDWVETHPG